MKPHGHRLCKIGLANNDGDLISAYCIAKYDKACGDAGGEGNDGITGDGQRLDRLSRKVANGFGVDGNDRMIRFDAVVGNIGSQHRWQAAGKLDQLDGGCGCSTGNPGLRREAARPRGYQIEDILGVKRLREPHDHRGRRVVQTYRQGSLFRYDEMRYLGAAKRHEFRKAPIIKSLDGQNEQSLLKRVDLNGSQGLQFRQSTADAYVFPTPKQG